MSGFLHSSLGLREVIDGFICCMGSCTGVAWPHLRARCHKRAHARLHLPLPQLPHLQTPILGYCYADPGTSTVLITPALTRIHARGVWSHLTQRT